MDKGQTLRYSKAEIELINNFTQSREDAVVILRNHFLQLELTDEQKTFISSLNADFYKVIYKTVIPELVADVPVTQEATLYSRLTMLDQIHPEVAIIQIQANDIFINYCKQQFNALTVDSTPTIVLNLLCNPVECTNDERVTNLIAYNNIVPLVEQRLNQLTALSPKPVLTEEEIKARDLADSSK